MYHEFILPVVFIVVLHSSNGYQQTTTSNRREIVSDDYDGSGAGWDLCGITPLFGKSNYH